MSTTSNVSSKTSLSKDAQSRIENCPKPPTCSTDKSGGFFPFYMKSDRCKGNGCCADATTISCVLTNVIHDTMFTCTSSTQSSNDLNISVCCGSVITPYITQIAGSNSLQNCSLKQTTLDQIKNDITQSLVDITKTVGIGGPEATKDVMEGVVENNITNETIINILNEAITTNVINFTQNIPQNCNTLSVDVEFTSGDRKSVNLSGLINDNIISNACRDTTSDSCIQKIIDHTINNMEISESSKQSMLNKYKINNYKNLFDEIIKDPKYKKFATLFMYTYDGKLIDYITSKSTMRKINYKNPSCKYSKGQITKNNKQCPIDEDGEIKAEQLKTWKNIVRASYKKDTNGNLVNNDLSRLFKNRDPKTVVMKMTILRYILDHPDSRVFMRGGVKFPNLLQKITGYNTLDGLFKNVRSINFVPESMTAEFGFCEGGCSTYTGPCSNFIVPQGVLQKSISRTILYGGANLETVSQVANQMAQELTKKTTKVGLLPIIIICATIGFVALMIAAIFGFTSGWVGAIIVIILALIFITCFGSGLFVWLNYDNEEQINEEEIEQEELDKELDKDADEYFGEDDAEETEKEENFFSY